MAKLVLNDVGNILTAASVINANNQRIEEALENTLSRDGTSPNPMDANLDLNNYRIYNLPDPKSDTEPLRKKDLDLFREAAESGIDNVVDPPGLKPIYDTGAYFKTSDPDGNGFFTDYDSKGAARWVMSQGEDQSGISGGGFRDLLFLHQIDEDTVNYTSIGQKVSYAVRGIVTGKYNTGTDTFDTQYKDLVGADFHAIGRVSWDARGVSGVVSGAIQYGTGIASNEFAVENPSAHEQSTSMAGVQAIVRAYKGADDGTHVYRAFMATNQGNRITTALQVQSAPLNGSYTGAYRYGIDFTSSVVDEIAIRLRGTGAGATVIEYDGNDYTLYDRSNNRWGYVVNGSTALFITANGLNFVGGPASPLIEYDTNDYQSYDKTNNRLNTLVGGTVVTSVSAAGLSVGSAATGATGAFLALSASTSTSSHLRFIPGATVSSPSNGDFWFDGTALKIQIGGVTRTVTVS